MKSPWKKIKSRLIYRNDWIKVIEDEVIRPDGKKGIYSTVETNGDSVFIVPVTDKEEIYLVNLFRYPIQKYSLEIPGGNSDGENLLKAAKRELKEEAGLSAKKWTKITCFTPFNGVTKEYSHVFLAQKITKTNINESVEEGINKITKIPLDTALNMIKTGKIFDGQTIAAILQTAMHLKKLVLSKRILNSN